MPSSNVADNVQIVRDFIRTAFSEGRAKEALDMYVGDRYTQHNPMAHDGPEGFLEAVRATIGSNPDFVFDTKRVIAQDDHVVLHSYMSLTGQAPGFAVVDIFRLEDGKIVEHWDVLQAVPEDPANDNSMF